MGKAISNKNLIVTPLTPTKSGAHCVTLRFYFKNNRSYFEYTIFLRNIFNRVELLFYLT